MIVVEQVKSYIDQFTLDQFQQLLELLALISMATFVLSIICIPLLVARLPQDYFQRSAILRGASSPQRVRPGNLMLMILRNIVGVVLLLAGIAMLFLPGQGIITMVIGLIVMQVPFKRNLIYRLTRPHSVRHSLDWLRMWMKKEPFYW